MKRAVPRKPLELTTETVKALDHLDLAKVAAGRADPTANSKGGTC